MWVVSRMIKEWDKQNNWEVESDKLVSKEKLGHWSGELNVEEDVRIGGIGNLEGEVMERCDKVMEEEEVEKSWVGDMEEDQILVSWTEDVIEEEVMIQRVEANIN